MQGKYENLSAAELRELCLKGELDADSMSLEELEKLFGYETELDEPQAEVLIFCTNGFDKYAKYRDDIPKPPLEKILKKHYGVKRRVSVPRAARLAAAIVLIVTVSAFMAQIVSMALGFNLFEFVRDWLFDKDTVGVLISEPDDEIGVDLREHRSEISTADTDSPDEPPVDEFVFLDFERIEDIDDEWLARVSPVLVERYEFVSADYMRFSGDEEFNIHFSNEDSNDVLLVIQNNPMFYVEREEELLVETLVIGSITFEIFNNMEDFQVIWEYDGYFYKLNAHLPLDEVKGIVEGWY
jgi:hypothetical protein